MLALQKAGVPIALATDCKPGTSPLVSPLLAMNFAAHLFGMTPAACLLGMTKYGAQALGMASTTGALEAGKWCDLAVWDTSQPADLVYWMGQRPLVGRA